MMEIRPTTRVPRPYPDYDLVGAVMPHSYVFHKCPDGHHLELLGPGWVCHECRKLWAMNNYIYEEWQKPEVCDIRNPGWQCARPHGHAGLCCAFMQKRDARVTLSPAEAIAVWQYIQGDSFEGGDLDTLLAKIEPVYYDSLRDDEVD